MATGWLVANWMGAEAMVRALVGEEEGPCVGGGEKKGPCVSWGKKKMVRAFRRTVVEI